MNFTLIDSSTICIREEMEESGLQVHNIVCLDNFLTVFTGTDKSCVALVSLLSLDQVENRLETPKLKSQLRNLG